MIGLAMIDLSIHQGQLVVYLFAHFLVVPFFVLAIINELRSLLLLLYNPTQKLSTQNALFFALIS